MVKIDFPQKILRMFRFFQRSFESWCLERVLKRLKCNQKKLETLDTTLEKHFTCGSDYYFSLFYPSSKFTKVRVSNHVMFTANTTLTLYLSFFLSIIHCFLIPIHSYSFFARKRMTLVYSLCRLSCFSFIT